MNTSTNAGPVESLETIAAARGAKQRDCRSCPQLEDQGDGLSYGCVAPTVSL